MANAPGNPIVGLPGAFGYLRVEAVYRIISSWPGMATKVAKKSPASESSHSTDRKMLSAVDCDFQWKIYPSTRRKMA